MRLALLLGAFGFVLAACSSGDGDGDAGMVFPDAAGMDASTADSGLFATPCGAATCTPEQYCQIDPTMACNSTMGTSCAATEEMCQSGGDAGCTTPRSRECRALPAACASTAQCACMINQNLCSGAVAAMCRRPVGEGVTIECPFQ